MSDTGQSGFTSDNLDPELVAQVEAWLMRPPPPEFLEGRDAFFRDLPALLEHRKLYPQEKWAAYHRQTRIGVGTSRLALIEEGSRRGFPREHIFSAGIDAALLDRDSYVLE
jgi:hypothetical protein